MHRSQRQMHTVQDKAVEDAVRALDMLEGMLQWLLRSSATAAATPAAAGRAAAAAGDSLPEAAALNEAPAPDAERSP